MTWARSCWRPDCRSSHKTAMELACREQIPAWQAEQQVFEASHAEVGAYLLGLWGLPDGVVEAVALHHDPSKCMMQEFGPLAAVHISDFLFHEHHRETATIPPPEMACGYIGKLGVAERVSSWRDMYAEAESVGIRDV